MLIINFPMGKYDGLSVRIGSTFTCVRFTHDIGKFRLDDLRTTLLHACYNHAFTRDLIANIMIFFSKMQIKVIK